MNHNFTLKCETCEDVTNIRFGFSNRELQPVRFACQTCGSPIDILMHLHTGGLEGATADFEGATLVPSNMPFEADTNFVDLHLDFPVSFEPYQMGNTPYLRAVARIGLDEMQIHQARLNQLNVTGEKTRFFETALKLYANGKIRQFTNTVQRQFGIKTASDRPEDINAALYRLVSNMMSPFEYPRQSSLDIDEFQNVIMTLHRENREGLQAFINELIERGFLKNLQKDILEMYPMIFRSEIALRPSLFLDFDEGYADSRIPMRVSTAQFETYKDLYKDISEVLSRELALVAGVNNLLKRGDYNLFAPLTNQRGQNIAPRNLNAFADVPFGKKLDLIDDSWFQFLDGSTDNRLRNSIAHYRTEYDPITQEIKIYPNREGLNQEASETLYFIEFLRRLLLTYREMHRLHHLLKAIYYYYFLIMKRD